MLVRTLFTRSYGALNARGRFAEKEINAVSLFLQWKPKDQSLIYQTKERVGGGRAVCSNPNRIFVILLMFCANSLKNFMVLKTTLSVFSLVPQILHVFPFCFMNTNAYKCHFEPKIGLFYFKYVTSKQPNCSVNMQGSMGKCLVFKKTNQQTNKQTKNTNKPKQTKNPTPVFVLEKNLPNITQFLTLFHLP